MADIRSKYAKFCFVRSSAFVAEGRDCRRAVFFSLAEAAHAPMLPRRNPSAWVDPVSHNSAVHHHRDHDGTVRPDAEIGAPLRERKEARRLAIVRDAEQAAAGLKVDVVSATITLDLDLYHRYRLSKGEILDALNAALKLNDWPFEHAKEACKAVAKICKGDLAKAAARDVCELVKPVEELPPAPTEVQLILAGTSNSNAQADVVKAGGPYANDIDTIGLKLPVWCFIKWQRYTFEVTMDHVVRGLAVNFSGLAQRNKNGSLSFSASKPVDIGYYDSDTATEKVTGTIRANGDLIVEDFGRYQYRGACRSVD